MEDEKKFSVVMPVYNRAEEMVPSIRSALKQSLRELELIIVDDERSSDDAETVARRMDDGRIRYFEHGTSVSEARNHGIKMAEAERIAFLDSDDFWRKNFLSEMYKGLEDNHCSTCYFRKVYESRGISDVESPCFRGHGIIYSLLRGHTLPPSAITFRKEVFEKVGVFDEQMCIWEDSDLWIRAISRFGEPAVIEKPLAVHIRRSESLSNSASQESYVENLERFIEKHEDILKRRGLYTERRSEI